MSEEVARLEELLARVQRNAALPRTVAPAAFTAPPPVPAAAPSAPRASAPLASAPQVSAPLSSAPLASAPYAPPPAFDPSDMPFESEPPPPAAVYEPEPPPLHVTFDSEPSAPGYPAPAALDQSVDDMLLADPFPSSPAPAAPPQSQSLTEMLDEDPIPLVSVAAQRPAPGEDISGVTTRSELGEEPPEELLEDDIVEMTSDGEAVVPANTSGLDDLNFDDDELLGDAHRADDEPPASSSRHRVAGTMDEALARAAEHIEIDEGREVPLKTPPPESGPQAAMALPVGIHAPLAPDIEELLEADILPVGGVRADLPTAEQLGQTIDLEEARGPHLELDSSLAAPPAPLQEELPSEELEVTLPRREFGGGYQDDLMPPPEARQELEAHRQRFAEAPGYDAPPESLAQYPSPQPAAPSQGFAPVATPQSVTTDSYSDSVSTVTVDAPANAELVPELLLRPDIDPSPVAKFIRLDAPRPRTFLELLDASLALGRD